MQVFHTSLPPSLAFSANLTGKNIEKITAAKTAQIIIEKPSEINFESGEYFMMQLKSADRTTTPKTDFIFFEGGIIIATNIPYIAIPRHETRIAGRICPKIAPESVPSVQPK